MTNPNEPERPEGKGRRARGRERDERREPAFGAAEPAGTDPSMNTRARADLDAAVSEATRGEPIEPIGLVDPADRIDLSSLSDEGTGAGPARVELALFPNEADAPVPPLPSGLISLTDDAPDDAPATRPDSATGDPASPPRVDPALTAGNRKPAAGYRATHFGWQVEAGVATVTLNRPERKNPLTFESYAELRDLFVQLRYADDVHAVVVTGAGDNFCSGGDVHEIIGPLVRLKAPELLMFTRMTGDLVKAMRACPQPIVAAVDGVCAGAGAIVAMASDLRFGTARSKTAFLFNRVGLAGCDMGACAMLPRLVGQGRASEWLYTGRSLGGEEAERWGFFNRLCAPGALLADALAMARDIAAGPTFANGITKTMLHQEWAMTIEQAIEAEAQAQALCMLTEDFGRAYRAFAAKQKPRFEGN